MNHDFTISAEEAAEIRRHAEALYPGQGIGPSISQFNKLRPLGMARSESLACRVAGSSRYRKAHWTVILHSLGLRHPTHREALDANREWQRQAEREALAEAAGFQLADLRTLDDGDIAYIKRQRVVRRWNLRTHSYDPVGCQVVYELV